MAARDRAFTIDASALVKAFKDEVHSPAFRQWHDHAKAEGIRLVAPALIQYELGHLIAKHFSDTPLRARAIREALRGVEIVRTPLARPFEFAPATYYDASYLAVADQEGALLITYDEVLAKVAGRAGLDCWAPTQDVPAPS